MIAADRRRVNVCVVHKFSARSPWTSAAPAAFCDPEFIRKARVSALTARRCRRACSNGAVAASGSPDSTAPATRRMPSVTRRRPSAGISRHAASRAAFAPALPAWRWGSRTGSIDRTGAFGARVRGQASHGSGVTLVAGSHVCRFTTVRSGFHKFPTQPMISPDSSLRMRTRIVPITINLCICEHFHRCSLQGNARKKTRRRRRRSAPGHACGMAHGRGARLCGHRHRVRGRRG